MDKNVLVVVARYKEDVSWVQKISYPVIIYDKSGKAGPYSLPNIGRETHTYLHHISNNYPFFSEYTIFLQGNPFAHLSLGSGIEDLERMILNFIAKKYLFKGFAGYSIRCDGFGLPNSIGFADSRWKSRTNIIPISKVYRDLFSGQAPGSYHCRAPAGIFGVHYSRILCRPLEFYKRAMDIVLNDPFDEMNVGHAFERLWYVIFNGYAALNKDEYK